MALTVDTILSKTKAASLQEVRSLNMFASGLRDISALKGCVNLEVLSLAQNSLDDEAIEVVSSLPALKELYLRRNNIQRVESLVILVRLRRTLTVLWLDENPVASDPFYRKLLLRMLPGLTKLDQGSVSEGDFKEAHGDDSAGLGLLLANAKRAEAAAAPLPIAAGHAGRVVRHDSITGSMRAPLPVGAGGMGSPQLSPGQVTPGTGGSGGGTGANTLPAILLLLRDLGEEGLDRVAAAVKELKSGKGGAAGAGSGTGRPRAGSGYT